ncbi:MAG: sensor domain-containing diguanylate cyclase [Nitrospirae bacterium]|nr:sensor domain-containing diguanylate cyclase [Nitrospirota bacterium]
MEPSVWASVLLLIATIVLSFLLLKEKKRHKDEIRGYLSTIRQLSILNELSAYLHTTMERDVVLESIMDRVKDLLRAEKSAIIIVDKHERITDFYSSLGPTGKCKTEVRGVIKRVFRELTPLRTDNIHDEPDFGGFPDRHPEIRNLLIVPIMLRGKAIGVLLVADKKGAPGFSSEDEDLLLTLAFHSAFAIEKVNLHEGIVKMASTDGLTGLNNHRAFQEKLEEEIERAKRFETRVVLLMIDIDHFKAFNDAYGHVCGDEALKRIACTLNDNIRTVDFAARYGGEEFAIILPEIPLEGATVVAERIRQAVERQRFRLNGKEARITLSIGVASFPDHALNRKDLIDRADKALYIAKRSGRNRVCIYTEE